MLTSFVNSEFFVASFEGEEGFEVETVVSLSEEDNSVGSFAEVELTSLSCGAGVILLLFIDCGEVVNGFGVEGVDGFGGEGVDDFVFERVLVILHSE
jgi:hypothetical protein